MHWFSRNTQAYLSALLVGPLAVLLMQLMDPTWRGRLLVIVLFAPVTLAAWLGGKRPGVLATIAVIVTYLPISWLKLLTTREWTNFCFTVVVYLLLGSLLSWLISAVQSARRRAEVEEHDRREAENTVREERERLRVTLSSIGDAVIVTDMNGNVTFMNPVAAELTGWEPANAVGKPLDQVFHILNEYTRAPVESPVTKVLREGMIVGLANHTVLIAKNGREIPIDDSGAPIRRDGGIIAGVVLVFRDVTESRRALQTRLHLAAIVESSDDAIISTNLENIITSWNNGAQRLYGYTAGEALGQPLSMLVPMDRQDELSAITQRIRRGDQLDHFETQRLSKDGRRVDVSLTVSPVRNAEDQVIGASKIARDITATKEADRRKNEFLALLAHELRNPLAPLRNGLEIMKFAPNDPQLVESTRNMMERQLQQLARLVDDLLDVSRISRGVIELRIERIALADVINAALETCKPLMQQAGHEVIVTSPEEPIYVEADKTRLAQVLANLLSNAAKYTGRGGRICLTVDQSNDQVVLRLKDNGIGIPAFMLPKVFDLFTQVDRSMEKSHGGLGVGLTIVKRLVEMHGGTVEAHSDGEGMGSEFIIRLPTADDSVHEQKREDEVPQVSPVLRRILVVDDNEDSANSLSILLKALGNEVQTAYDGMTAVDIASAFRPEVILLDIGMPKLNGYDTCRRIRDEPWAKDVLIVALTGWGKEEDRERSRDAGFDHHLVKPVEPVAIKKLLARTR